MARPLKISASLFLITLLPLPLLAEPRLMIKDGVYAQGNISNSQITISNITPDQITAAIDAATHPLQKQTVEQKAQIAKLQRQLGINRAQLDAFFGIIGEADIPFERVGLKLIEIANDYQRIRSELADTPNEEIQIASLKRQARFALDQPDLEKSANLLAEVQALQEKDTDQYSLNVAATIAQRGSIALTMLHYQEAASLFAKAAAKVPPGYKIKRDEYLEQQASALFKHGYEHGDNDSLSELIHFRYKQLADIDRQSQPAIWADIQYNLGNALMVLGKREIKKNYLNLAVSAFQSALEERPRDLTPLKWAATQNKLGTTLKILGKRESGIKSLESAIRAYRLALEERSRELVPLKWAATLHNLGTALRILAKRKNETAHLKEAVDAYRQSLEERNRRLVPLKWAMTQNDLGTTLRMLSKYEAESTHLKAAIETYHLALEERTRERVPLQWAATQNHLGTALRMLGKHETTTTYLKTSAKAYRLALEERTYERVPLQWAETQHNLGITLLFIGRRESGNEQLEEAMSALTAARDTYLNAGYKQYVPDIEKKISSILILIADHNQK